eukprot:818881-Pelagomonas_calceolata.AAC.1
MIYLSDVTVEQAHPAVVRQVVSSSLPRQALRITLFAVEKVLHLCPPSMQRAQHLALSSTANLFV